MAECLTIAVECENGGFKPQRLDLFANHTIDVFRGVGFLDRLRRLPQCKERFTAAVQGFFRFLAGV